MMEVKKVGLLDKFVIQVFAPSLQKKTNFFRLLAVAQKAWLGVRDALVSIRKSERQRGMLLIIDDLISQLTQWVSLGVAMENHDYVFWKDEIALVKSSEVIGNMPDVLSDIAIENENMQQIRNKIAKAMAYPIILICFTVIAVVILLLYVVPTIVGMFPVGTSLPWVTSFMLDVSFFLQGSWFFLLVLIILIVAVIHMLYKYFLPFKIFVDKLFLSLPAIGAVIKTFYMYRFSKLLGQFYIAGLSVTVGLVLMKDIFQNFFYQKKALEIKEDLESGFSFAEAMEWSPLFDAILIQIIYVGEDTGNIAEVLLKMANYYRDMLDTKIAILMSLIEPFLLAFVAIVIGVVVWSIFLPMAELVNVIQ
jgi:type IV pilus assembly protein PilC